MKLGNIIVKRRYSFIQILVDLFSAAALLYIGFIVYSCALDIEELKRLNHTETSLDFLRWQPLVIWVIAGVVLWVLSLLALLLPRKQPKRFFVSAKNAVKFCNAVDVCISCVRLIALLALSELCYLHMQAILQRTPEFSVQLVCDAVIIVLLIWFTRIRLTGISENARNEEKENKEHRIIED